MWVTAWLVILACGGVYELTAIVTGNWKWTISAMTWRVSARYPLIPFMIGLVMGHLFWQAH